MQNFGTGAFPVGLRYASITISLGWSRSCHAVVLLWRLRSLQDTSTVTPGKHLNQANISFCYDMIALVQQLPYSRCTYVTAAFMGFLLYFLLLICGSLIPWGFPKYVNFEQGQNKLCEVEIMKIQILFYYDKGVSTVLCHSCYHSQHFDQNFEV